MRGCAGSPLGSGVRGWTIRRGDLGRSRSGGRRSAVRARSALTTDLDGLYAAQRLSMVRLALLLVGDRDVAEAIVQRAFLGLLRRTDRRRVDRGVVVAELRTRVVMGCRAVRRRRRPDMRQHVLGHDTYG